MLSHRLATSADTPSLRRLMAEAISNLQIPYLTPAQIEASRGIMGLDTQLIEDGTYFVVLEDGLLAGCGGWSRRATLFGGDHSAGRNAALLDPACDAARVRAMYTAPHFARRGVGRLVLRLSEDAAASQGFSRVELAATRGRGAVFGLRLHPDRGVHRRPCGRGGAARQDGQDPAAGGRATPYRRKARRSPAHRLSTIAIMGLCSAKPGWSRVSRSGNGSKSDE